MVASLMSIGEFEMLADKIVRVSPEAFRNRLKSYPDREKPVRAGLAMKFSEKRRQRLAQMSEVDIQDAELAFERFKISINSDRPDGAKLYL